MTAQQALRPRVFRPVGEEAGRIDRTPFGSVGQMHVGDGVEAVWVSKQPHQVDPGWFVSDRVDVLVLVAGRMRVQFDSPDLPDEDLHVGDVLVLPAGQRCRVHPTTGDEGRPAVFVAVYPTDAAGHRA
jgi:quercetin dioxygenase-like cupin family protein